MVELVHIVNHSTYKWTSKEFVVLKCFKIFNNNFQFKTHFYARKVLKSFLINMF